jgi:hypothetical protein
MSTTKLFISDNSLICVYRILRLIRYTNVKLAVVVLYQIHHGGSGSRSILSGGTRQAFKQQSKG